MNSTRLFQATSVVALALVVSFSCSNDHSPSQPTSLSQATPNSPSESSPSRSSNYRTEGASAVNQLEQFNCTSVGGARIRFGEPGWVQDNAVGLFVNYVGVPDTKMTLRIWWDFENAPEKHEDVELDGEDIRRAGELLEIKKIVEHTYNDVREKTVRTVRVHLTLADETGNCARVRRVTLAPPPPTKVVVTKGPPPVTICGTANEGSTVALKCPVGKTMKTIVFASYGTPNGTCGSFTNGACHAANSKTIVSAACVGNAACNVGANNGVFGDPCGGTVKRLYVEATCQ